MVSFEIDSSLFGAVDQLTDVVVGNCINFYAKFKVTKLWHLVTDTSRSSRATSLKKNLVTLSSY
jgi:hypothetical protein